MIGHLFFGKQRKMVVRQRETERNIEIELDHGKMLIMQGENFQHNYQYGVQRDSVVTGTSYLCTLYTLPTQRRADRSLNKTN